jgi:hypothetical protein
MCTPPPWFGVVAVGAEPVVAEEVVSVGVAGVVAAVVVAVAGVGVGGVTGVVGVVAAVVAAVGGATGVSETVVVAVVVAERDAVVFATVVAVVEVAAVAAVGAIVESSAPPTFLVRLLRGFANAASSCGVKKTLTDFSVIPYTRLRKSKNYLFMEFWWDLLELRDCGIAGIAALSS